MKQKTRFTNFGNTVSSYRPQKSHIGRSLAMTLLAGEFESIHVAYYIIATYDRKKWWVLSEVLDWIVTLESISDGLMRLGMLRKNVKTTQDSQRSSKNGKTVQ